ncbi:hypothetical protein JCM6882_000912 [Rhodosporidiobolus microsporus]
MTASKLDTAQQKNVLDTLWPLSRFVGYRPPTPPQTAEGEARAEHGTSPRWTNYKRRNHGRQALGRDRRESQDEGVEEDATLRSPATPPLSMVVGDKLLNMFLTLIGSFFGTVFLALLARAPFLASHSAPLVLGSFGSEGVLLYAAHEAPMAQPKNVIFGNSIGAILGVAVAKGFGTIEGFQVGEVFGKNWAAVSVSLALSLFVMQIFEIAHPPGGATAVLAVTIPQVAALGWWLVPQVLVASLIMFGWALVVNNLGGRRYPSEWWWKNKWIVI